MNTEFEMSDVQLKMIMTASQPVAYIAVTGIEPRSPQENANNAWERLGNEMGFHHMTVRPSYKGKRFFTATATDKT